MTQMIYKLWDSADEDGACRVGTTENLRRTMQDHFSELRRRGDRRTQPELIVSHRLVVVAHMETRADAEQAKREVIAEMQRRGELQWQSAAS